MDGENELIAAGGINVNTVPDVPWSSAVATVMLPVAPVPTTAVITLSLATVNDVAGVPPKFTDVVPVKLAPFMVTTVPAGPLVGVNEVMDAGERNVNTIDDTPVPPGDVTVILPVVPVPTTAVITVSDTTVNDVAAVPPKLTLVAPLKCKPLMVSVAAVCALIGEKLVITGNPAVVALIVAE